MNHPNPDYLDAASRFRRVETRLDRIETLLALLPPREGLTYEGRDAEIDKFWAVQHEIRRALGYPDPPAMCSCGQMRLQGGTVELGGIKHCPDVPCYRCDSYGNAV